MQQQILPEESGLLNTQEGAAVPAEAEKKPSSVLRTDFEPQITPLTSSISRIGNRNKEGRERERETDKRALAERTRAGTRKGYMTL